MGQAVDLTQLISYSVFVYAVAIGVVVVVFQVISGPIPYPAAPDGQNEYDWEPPEMMEEFRYLMDDLLITAIALKVGTPDHLGRRKITVHEHTPPFPVRTHIFDPDGSVHEADVPEM